MIFFLILVPVVPKTVPKTLEFCFYKTPILQYRVHVDTQLYLYPYIHDSRLLLTHFARVVRHTIC